MSSWERQMKIERMYQYVGLAIERFQVWILSESQIFCNEIKILNPGSRDISQKLRQTKCLIFDFWMIRLTKTPILPNCQVQNSFFWYDIHFDLQTLKIIHLVCFSFCDILRDPGFRISISVQKMCPKNVRSPVGLR